MFNRLFDYLNLARAYVVLNIKMQLEYRAAFLSQVAAMAFNDFVWLGFWTVFFSRFPAVNGWTAADVVMLWSVTATGFGLAHAFCGNALRLAQIITNGELDTWMLYPRALLPHLLVGRLSPNAMGDVLFGLSAYLLFVHPDWQHLAMFMLLTISVAVLFVGFSVLSGSLSFYLGNAESLSEQWRFSLLTFSTYPSELFQGQEKYLLYTLIPAAFVNNLPIAALKSLSPLHAAAAMAGSIGVVLCAVAVFYHGLRRYESGNLLSMRG